MAEEFGDKTEAPTPRRREEAREQGQIARSPDLSAAILLLGFLLLMNSFGQGLVQALRVLLQELLSAPVLCDFDVHKAGSILVRCIALAGGALAPLLLGGLLIGVAVNLLQVGFYLNGKRLQPKLGALNPLNGAARLVKPENWVHLLMNILKIALVGVVAWSAVRGRLDQIVATQQLEFAQAFSLGCSIVYAVGLRLAVLLLVLALIDYGYQRYRHERELRMTKQEIKEEMRRMEGDPKIKQRRRQLAIQMAHQRLRKDVPTADVIITNPTEYAIALKYDSSTMHAPRVVAKGRGYMAQRIREIAIENGVPIVERKPLARALYSLVEVGQEIPEQFYSAVAEILAYVYRLTGKMKDREVA